MEKVTEVALALEVSEDRGHTSIVTAGQLNDEDVLIELVAYLDGVSGAVAAALDMSSARKVVATIIDPHSGAATMIKAIEDARVTVTQPTTSEAGIAHNGYLDLFRAGHVKHVRNHVLTTAMKHYEQRRLGEGTLWMRRGAPVDVSPAIASALATWGLLNAPPPRAEPWAVYA